MSPQGAKAYSTPSTAQTTATGTMSQKSSFMCKRSFLFNDHRRPRP